MIHSNVTSVIGGASYNADITDGQEYITAQAFTATSYRLQLAYKDCAILDSFGEGFDPLDGQSIVMTYTGQDGEETALEPEPKLSTESSDVRNIGEDDVVYFYDTGEILVGKNVFSAIQEAQASISIQYLKSDFDKFDVRPEMYFEAQSHDTITNKTISYSEPEKQTINYEINFSQTIDVNTQARDAFSTDIYRNIDYIEQTVKYVDETDIKLDEVKKMIDNSTDESQIATLNSLKRALEDEKKLRVSVMAEAFGMGITMVDKVQEQLNVALADCGARYKRTELTYDKLLDNRLDTEDKMSENEGVDLPDVYINATQAENLYQASLQITSRVLGNSLLDYI